MLEEVTRLKKQRKHPVHLFSRCFILSSISDANVCSFLLTVSVSFPGCIAASQRNDNVYVSGISNGEATTTLVSHRTRSPGRAEGLQCESNRLSVCLSVSFPVSLSPRLHVSPSPLCPACGDVAELLRASSGIITSPGWPFQYPSRLNCSWNIRARAGDTITIR